MANERLKTILAGINSSDASIQRALRVLAVKFRSEEDDEALEALDTLTQSVGPLFNEKMRSRLASFESYCDKEKLEPLLAKLTDQITTFSGAMSAIEGFDIKWFRQLALSNTAKQSLAATLIKLCEQYANGSNGFWHELVNGDADVLYAVSFDLFDPEDVSDDEKES
jgi:hypothetical protein